MIITITGKPCSGKGTVGKAYCKKYNFEYMSTGDMFRSIASERGYSNILEFQKSKEIYDVDREIDSRTQAIGKAREKDDLLIDSRMAWHFIPHSFKVFLDVSLQTAGKRLIEAERELEKPESLEHAMQILLDRWQTEKIRYQKLYNTSNLDQSNYDLVISTDNKSIDEIVELIHTEYVKFLKKIQ